MKKFLSIPLFIILISTQAFASEEVYLDFNNNFKKHTINNNRTIPKETSYADEEMDEDIDNFIGEDDEVNISPSLNSADMIQNSNTVNPQTRLFNGIYPSARF